MKYKVLNLIIENEVITSSRIAQILNTNEPYVRKIINDFRSKGVPICSCNEGYFYGYLQGDIQTTIKSLENRVNNQIRAINGLKSCLKSC